MWRGFFVESYHFVSGGKEFWLGLPKASMRYCWYWLKDKAKKLQEESG